LREAFTGADVVRAERSNTGFLRLGQWHPDIPVNPRQRFIAFYGIYLIAFGLRQFHTLHHRFTIYQRGTAANCPDAAAVFVGRQAVALFLIQKLIENNGCGAPASTSPRTAALSLVLLVAIIPGLFSTVVFDFEIKIGQVRQQAKKNTGENANSSPLARADFVE
jgi:hypothetical protein